MHTSVSFLKKAEHLAISASVLAVIALTGMGVLGSYGYHTPSVLGKQVNALSIALGVEEDAAATAGDEGSADVTVDTSVVEDEDTA